MFNFFDIDAQCLEKNYHHSSWQNAYSDIRREHTKHRFNNIQGMVYLSDRGVRQAHSILALQEIAIKTMSILAGKLPLKVLGLFMDWATQHRD